MTSAHDHSALPTVEVRHRLRIAREWAGLDQEQLAERMEVVRATVSNAETGRSNPSRKTVRDWALACGVPREWILTGEHPDSGPEPSSGLGIIRTEHRAPASKHASVTAISGQPKHVDPATGSSTRHCA